MTRRGTLALIALLLSGILAGCGFHLRGQSSLPFSSVWVEAGDSSLKTGLQRHLQERGKLAETREKAELVVVLTEQKHTKTILSLSGSGKVREYRLTQSLEMAALSPAGSERLPPATLQVGRDYSYSDTLTLAKEAEAAQLERDMEDELLRQVLRRLSLAGNR